MSWRLPTLSLVLGVLLAGSPVAAQSFNPLRAVFSLFDRDSRTTAIGTSEFPRPVWMAVISTEKGARLLVAAGDPIFREAEPRAIGIIRAVTPVSLTLDLGGESREMRAFPGRSIPGARDLIFQDTVLVRTLEYRHRVVEEGQLKVLGGELYLAGLENARAILQRDVDPPPSRAAILRQRLEAIPIVQRAPRTFEVKASDVRTAMESGEEIVNQAIRDSRLDLSPDKGIGMELKTPLANVRMDNRGFTVTDPNLASKIGIVVGDRITNVNGMPIDSLTALVQAYLHIKFQPSIRTVRVTVERGPMRLAFRYHIR